MSLGRLLRRVCGLALLITAAACAGTRPGPAARAAERLAEVERHALPAVEDFHFWKLDRWEALGKEAILVWPHPNEAYLIRVRAPCSGLEFANGLSLTSTLRRVHRRFDFVLFEQQRCRIAEIRPIDVRSLKAERRNSTGSD